MLRLRSCSGRISPGASAEVRTEIGKVFHEDRDEDRDEAPNEDLIV